MVIVVNDNGRSYSPTIGGMADHLAALRLRPSYERALAMTKRALRGSTVGRAVYTGLHALKEGVKDAVSPQAMFSDLGLKYVGPVDGHDVRALESALRHAKGFGGAVIVHAVTRKGMGLPAGRERRRRADAQPARLRPGHRRAGRPALDRVDERVRRPRCWPSGRAGRTSSRSPPPCSGRPGWRRSPRGYPDRSVDVGIAEQHALTSAAGLALGGLHPVVAVYSTFLNRAFDQLLLDVALHRAPVTVVLDRAGVTGSDGPSHNGMWDLSILGVVPGIRVAAPRDAGSAARGAAPRPLEIDDGPTVLRFPKGAVIEDVPAVRRVGGVDVLREPATATRDAPADVLLVCVGVFGQLGLDVADRLADQGIGVTVVDPRWVLPVPPALVELAAGHRLVVSVEDCGRHGGLRLGAGRGRCGTPAATCRCATWGCRSVSSSTAAGRTCSRRPG